MTIDTDKMNPVELLEVATGEVDHMFQEGVIIKPEEYKRLVACVKHLQGITKEWPEWFPPSVDRTQYK
jgi:hypothetical protein